MYHAMRFPTSSCLLCKHTILARSWAVPRTPIASFRPASALSAIHHGLRQSEKSRPQGFKRDSLEAAKSSRTPRNSRDRDRTAPVFKIKRGKKDITDRGPKRSSRRARFNDPNDSFGKNSVVFQAKHGALREKMAELEKLGSKGAGSSSRSGRGAPMTSDDFMKTFESSGDRSTRPRRDDRSERRSTRESRAPDSRTRSSAFAGSRDSNRERARPDSGARPSERRESRMQSSADRGSRGSDRERARPDSDARPYERRDTRMPSSADRGSRGSIQESRWSPSDGKDPRRERSARPDAESFDRERKPRKEHVETSSFAPRRAPSDGEPTHGKGGESGVTEDTWKAPRRIRDDDGPIRIHHTTAASQFLYGRSVVEAALRSARRQLYKLYIYNGDDRQNLSQDKALERMAERKGVDVVRVPNHDLRMMDKMSGGRPHNGCVLEASPLPQPPLKALGPLSEDPAKPGFLIEVGYQSAEDAKVNGTSNLVPYHLPRGRHPLVLLLHGILDPGNLGAILRTAAFLGVNGIAITKSNSATLTSVALKASAGASEAATLFSVGSTRDFLTRSKENGWMVYAAVPATRRTKGNSHVTVDRVETYDPLAQQPTLLVIGSEGEGLDKATVRLADHEVSIPSPPGALTEIVDSLNVSVATGILCASFLKRQSAGMMDIEESLSSDATGGEGEAHLW
ncbi:RNA methyltransferase [Xylariaceae sp. FL0594]|nr:RNA methyltransferase [Xylariaceae sp. FL0594]